VVLVVLVQRLPQAAQAVQVLEQVALLQAAQLALALLHV
jgi:hypothetical protein